MSINVYEFQGLVNVLIEHHPNIGDIVSNKYLKVMETKSPKWDIYHTLFHLQHMRFKIFTLQVS